VEQPSLPEDGYHLTIDLTDRALSFIQDSKAIVPDKPFFLYYCPGACHAPHHAPKEWADKYKGKFDMGYEAYREVVFERQKTLGIVPEGAELTAIKPYIDETSADDKASPELDTVRLLDYLEESGQLDNPLIVLVSDNGASGEGGPNGSVNENELFNGLPDKIEGALPFLDVLGSPKTYNHYPTGWACAFNTPFKLWKRYSNWEGGTADPMIVSWPAKLKQTGVRRQYTHAVDIVPTIYELFGVDPPEVVKGYTQHPLEGVSFAATFDDAEAKTDKQTQFYSMGGTRAIWARASAATPCTSTRQWPRASGRDRCPGAGSARRDRTADRADR